MNRRISIDPLTRLEGHGRVEIFLDSNGEVENAYFLVPELRGFEQFCVGRPAEEMPRITNRICGLCPEAHHVASAKTLDALYQVEPPPAARRIRELFYCAFYVLDHTTHFFILGGPDFLVGAEAPVAERNVFGVVRKLGQELGKRVIETRARCNHVLRLLGGRSIHPVTALPGGWSVAVTEAIKDEIETAARANVEFALSTLRLFEEVVLGNQKNVALIVSDTYADRTHYMGMVDEQNRVNFYDGTLRVVAPDGSERLRFPARDYGRHIAEHVEPWTYLKFPYLKDVGWQGFVDGPESGVYAATPLSRLNAADGMATPGAQENYEKMYETLGSSRVNGRYRPVHYRLATHWARLIELLYAAERMLELATDPEICDPRVRAVIEATPSEGVGCVEAPRGTLFHHYWTDPQGLITRVNLVVGTTNNHAPIAMSIKKAAQRLIKKGGEVSAGLLNQIEMVVRSYDPCLSCATHSIPGRFVPEVTLRDEKGRVIRRISHDPLS